MIEIDAFALIDVEPATVDAFLLADREVQTGFAYQQAGIVRRTTARSDTSWVVITQWSDGAAADAAARAAAGDAFVAAFDALIDPSSRRTERFEPLAG